MFPLYSTSKLAGVDAKTKFRWAMMIAECNTCHSCGVFREPNHDCHGRRIWALVMSMVRGYTPPAPEEQQ